jgi:hypothetical protein
MSRHCQFRVDSTGRSTHQELSSGAWWSIREGELADCEFCPAKFVYTLSQHLLSAKRRYMRRTRHVSLIVLIPGWRVEALDSKKSPSVELLCQPELMLATLTG